MEAYHFRLAQQHELEEIHNLYRAATENPYSVWNAEYPSMADAIRDFETGNLYVLAEGRKIIGTLSVLPENELDSFNLWKISNGTQHEIARITIRKTHQGQGLAGKMVDSITKILKSTGCQAIHLSAAICNIPAWKTYRKLGFEILGEADLYDSRYYLMEKVL